MVSIINFRKEFIYMDKFRINLRKKMDKYIKLNGISYEYFNRVEGIKDIRGIKQVGSTRFKTLFEISKFLNIDVRNLLMFDDNTYIFKNSFDTFEEFFLFLGKRLKEFRLIKKMKALDIAKEIDININTVFRIENSKSIVSLEIFYKYLNVLEITSDEFFLKDEVYEIKDISAEEIITLDDFNDRIYEIEEINGRELGKSVLYNFGELPTLHVFLKICKSLRVSPKDFFDFDKKEFGEDFKIIDISSSANFIKQKLELKGVKVQRYIKLDSIFLFCNENNILIKDFFEKLCTDGKDNQMSMKLHGSLDEPKVS